MTATHATLYESTTGDLYMTTGGPDAPLYRLHQPARDNFEGAAVALLNEEDFHEGKEWHEPLVPPGTVDLSGADPRAVAIYDDTVGRVEVFTDPATGAPLAGPAGRRFLGLVAALPRQ